MTLRHRAAVAVPLMLAALLAGSATAHAASPSQTIFDGTLAAPKGTYETACHAAYRPGQAGVATRSRQRVRVPARSPSSSPATRVTGTSPCSTQTGRALAADASPDAQEVALGYTVGGTLNLQACRRSGAAASVPASLQFAAVSPAAIEKAKANPPRLVSVITPTRARKQELMKLGLDMTEHGGTETLGVVLHGADDEQALRKAGFRWRVLVSDLYAQGKADRAADRRYAAKATRSAFPSGRDTYRTLADYNAELKQLAAQNPNLVRLITLPNKTWLGKDVLGVEITENVNRNDGKPAFANLGVHHAREWPSGEHAMEWAIELVKGFKSGNPRATNIVRNSRNLVVPVVNADGFEASRNAVGAPADGRDESVDDTVYIAGSAGNGGEYRRKNCRLPDDSEAGNCATSAGLAEPGVDPNRNYGTFWGGPGSDTNPLDPDLPRPRPVLRARVAQHQGPRVPQPGDDADHQPHDRRRWCCARPASPRSATRSTRTAATRRSATRWRRTTATSARRASSSTTRPARPRTGATTPPAASASRSRSTAARRTTTTGDCDDPAFHPRFATTANEWTGDNPQANHTLPGAPNAGFDGKGNREAYYLAAESALNEQRHSVLEGTAPAGATLRLTKQFKTEIVPAGRQQAAADRRQARHGL